MSQGQAPPTGFGITQDSPVRWVYDYDRLGTVVDTHPAKGLLVYCSWTEAGEWMSPESLCLDLDRPTGRIHAVWAILERLAETICSVGLVLTRPRSRPVTDASWVSGHMACEVVHPDLHGASSIRLRGPDWTGQVVGTFRDMESLRGLQGAPPEVQIAAIMHELWGET